MIIDQKLRAGVFAPPPNKKEKQAGAELGQAQLKLGLDFNFFKFFVDLVSLDLDS